MSRFLRYFFPHDHKADHFSSLDGLRGVAVLIVILSHSSNDGLFLLSFLDFHHIGKLGVYLFFVLSAYLLDRQIALALRDHRANTKYWKNYALRRFLRIFPLYTVALIIYYLLNHVNIHTNILDLKDIYRHLLLQEGDHVFWSIPVEFKYYFLSPIIMLFCHFVLKWKKKYVFVFLFLLILFSGAVSIKYNLGSLNTFRFLPFFLVGTILSIYEAFYIEDIKKFDTQQWGFIGILSCLLILASFPSLHKTLYGFDKEINIHSVKYYIPYALLWSMVLASLRFRKARLNAFFSNKILRFIGAISFSVYLFHGPVIILVTTKMNLNSSLGFFVFCILTILISSFFYLTIEYPLSKFRLKKKV